MSSASPQSRARRRDGETLLPGVTVLCGTSIGSDADLTVERFPYRRYCIERGSAHGNFLYVRPVPPRATTSV